MEMRRIQMIVIFIVITDIGMNDAQGPTIQVQAIVQGMAHLPCNIKPPMKNDSTILVVWYRNEMDAVYSYDARRRYPEANNHWKNSTVIGNRVFFRLLPEPATLIIEDIKPLDAGSYRCRVDFQRSPTKNHKIWLQVIEPPGKPIIYDSKGGKVSTYSGPFEESTDVKFTCRVYGGFPTPKVWWRRDEVLSDSKMTVNEDKNYVEAELTIRKVSRFDLRATYTCQASNNNIGVPQTAAVILDLSLNPLDVTILSSRQPLSVDRKYEVVCQAVGSRPPAKITWWIDNERLTNYTDTISADENVTTSTLLFMPVVKDHNKTLTCRAINIKLKPGIAEDSWLLDITFLPVPILEFGFQMSTSNDIEENENAFFECKVYANPRVYKIIWRHDGYAVQHDPKSGVIVNLGTLELRSITRKQSGNYTCFASNVEGDNESNALELRVMYKPICRANQRLIYGLAPNENAHIFCEVEAYPFADAFSWSFNHSEERTEAEKRRKSERKRNTSILHITSVSEVDYGYLLCSAQNVIGEQTEPCVFRIIPAGSPQPPHNCTIVNQTSISLGVKCTPGFDGGQPTLFILYVMDRDSGMIVANSSASTPSFFIDNLNPDTTVTINLYAENERGRSSTMMVEGSTLNNAEKRTGVPSSISYTPYVMLLVGMSVFCSLSAVVITGAVRAQAFFGHTSHCFGRDVSQSTSLKQDLSAVEQSINFDLSGDEDKNPDVVLSTKEEDKYEILHLDTNLSPECCYTNNKSLKSSSLSSLPSPRVHKDLPLWHSTNSTMSRSGGAAKKANRKRPQCDVGFTKLGHIEYNNKSCNRSVVADPLSQQVRLGNTASCNVIRMFSQKEIVTVRTPLTSNQQESCV